MKALFVLVLTLSSSAHALDRFVVIADSHGVGQFGMSLVQWLSDRSDTRYDFYASGGTAPKNWLRGGRKSACVWHVSSELPSSGPPRYTTDTNPSFKQLWLNQGERQPNERRISVIVQGTNLNYVRHARYARSENQQMKDLIRDAYAQSDLCYWVGPPTMIKQNYNAPAARLWIGMIKKAIQEEAEENDRAPCEFLDSVPISKFPKLSARHKDQVHYHWMGSVHDDAGIIAAYNWAFQVISWLESKIPLR